MKAPALIVLFLSGVLGACDSGSGSGSASSDQDFAATLAQVTLPEEHADGEALFNANCATCHGQRALGTDRGPPLVHIIYEPSHHADIAFVMAAERGVRAHHWSFGDMAPVSGVDRSDLAEVIAYVRFLQREVGIQ
jgi:mono/diheme cytochrome c family protein